MIYKDFLALISIHVRASSHKVRVTRIFAPRRADNEQSSGITEGRKATSRELPQSKRSTTPKRRTGTPQGANKQVCRARTSAPQAPTNCPTDPTQDQAQPRAAPHTARGPDTPRTAPKSKATGTRQSGPAPPDRQRANRARKTGEREQGRRQEHPGVEDTQQPSQQQPGRVGDREQPAPGETGPDHPTRKAQAGEEPREGRDEEGRGSVALEIRRGERVGGLGAFNQIELLAEPNERSVNCLLYTSPSPRDS